MAKTETKIETSQLKSTAKSSAIYGFGTLVRQLTGFIMLPIYTRYLTPADYGAVELLTLVIQLAGMLVGMRISQAMFRYYILAKDQQEKEVLVSTVFLSVLALTTCAAIALNLVMEPIAEVIFGTQEFILELRLFMVVLVLNAIHNVSFSYLRARRKPVMYVTLNIVMLGFQVLFNVVFVVMYEMHVLGVVYGTLVSGSIMACVLGGYLISSVGLHYSWSEAKRLYRFVGPLIVAALGSFYVAFADRYFLRVFGSLSDVGLYTLACRLSSILITVYGAFHMSWSADRFEVYKQANAREIYDQIFRFMSAGVILIGAGISMFTNDVLYIMTAPEFYAAADAVPIIVVALIFNVFTMFCNFGIVLSENTRHMAESSWLKACVATIGCVALIPSMGIVGAALAIALSNMAAFVWVISRSKRYYDMELNWKAVNSLALVAVVVVILTHFIPDDVQLSFLIKVMMFLLLVVFFYKMPIWNNQERLMMLAPLKKLKMGKGGGSA